MTKPFYLNFPHLPKLDPKFLEEAAGADYRRFPTDECADTAYTSFSTTDFVKELIKYCGFACALYIRNSPMHC